jgi:hypothetical protein
LLIRVDGEWAQEQRWAILAGVDIPQTYGADDPVAVACDEGEAARRQASGAQALGRLQHTIGPHRPVKQDLAGAEVFRLLFRDLNHLTHSNRSHPALSLSRGFIEPRVAAAA